MTWPPDSQRTFRGIPGQHQLHRTDQRAAWRLHHRLPEHRADRTLGASLDAAFGLQRGRPLPSFARCHSGRHCDGPECTIKNNDLEDAFDGGVAALVSADLKIKPGELYGHQNLTFTWSNKDRTSLIQARSSAKSSMSLAYHPMRLIEHERSDLDGHLQR